MHNWGCRRFTFDNGDDEQVFGKEGLPAEVPLGDLLVVGHVAQPATQHLQPLGEERLLQDGHHVVAGHYAVPRHEPPPGIWKK